MLGVKSIDRVSPIRSKSKVTGKSNSPKSRWLSMSERVLSPQPSKVAAVVSEKSTVVKESVVKSIEKLTVVKESDVTSKVGKSNISAVVSEKSAVDEKDNPKVFKVSDESNKAAVVAPVIEKVSVSTENDKETELVVVADVKAPVVTAVESVVEKDNLKVTSKVSDESVKTPIVKESVKVPVVKKNVKASSVIADKPFSVVANKVDVVKDNINVVADKMVKENVLSVVADKALNINVVAESYRVSRMATTTRSSITIDPYPDLRDREDAKRRLRADYFDDHSGANNDINVLDNSPLFDDQLDDLAPVVSCVVSGVEYRNGYYLVDGIYPEVNANNVDRSM
nr:hypothetical protein [Tanacetum cinerariifolium]